MSFELPRVTRFLFCISLRVGALVIGYTSMISALVGLTSSAFFIYLVALYVQQQKGHPPQGHTTGDVINNAIRLYIVHGLQLFVCLFYFVISLLLVIGIHKNRPRLMRHYFVAGMMNLVLNLFLLTVGFVFTGFYTTMSQLISCAIMFYFLIVVRSSYLEMEEVMKPKNVEMQHQVPLVYQ